MTDPIGERVARLEAVLPEIRDDIKQLKHAVLEQLKDHEHRISSLERLRYWGAGALAVAGAIVGFLFEWLRGGR